MKPYLKKKLSPERFQSPHEDDAKKREKWERAQRGAGGEPDKIDEKAEEENFPGTIPESKKDHADERDPGSECHRRDKSYRNEEDTERCVEHRVCLTERFQGQRTRSGVLRG